MLFCGSGRHVLGDPEKLALEQQVSAGDTNPVRKVPLLSPHHSAEQDLACVRRARRWQPSDLVSIVKERGRTQALGPFALVPGTNQHRRASFPQAAKGVGRGTSTFPPPQIRLACLSRLSIKL